MGIDLVRVFDDCRGKPEHPRIHREKMQTPHGKALHASEVNAGTEAAVLITIMER